MDKMIDNRLLGIAKKAGLLEIGEESVSQAAKSRKARLILSAADASESSLRHARGYAELCGCVHAILPSAKDELGALVGRGSPGMLAVTDAGIASKYVSQLAQADPEQYAEAAAKLEASALRAMQRRKEAEAQRRNRKKGKPRSKNRRTDETNEPVRGGQKDEHDV
jgi:ribosomal protein L7Ae-like RNA K-turn-binding protein